jgi:hypothetical protein
MLRELQELLCRLIFDGLGERSRRLYELRQKLLSLCGNVRKDDCILHLQLSLELRVHSEHGRFREQIRCNEDIGELPRVGPQSSIISRQHQLCVAGRYVLSKAEREGGRLTEFARYVCHSLLLIKK